MQSLAHALAGFALVALLAFAVTEAPLPFASTGLHRVAPAEDATATTPGVGERLARSARALGNPAGPDAPAPLHVAAAALPSTLVTATAAWLVALVCGLPLGLWAGLARGARVSAMVRTLLVIAASIPVVVALVLVQAGMDAGFAHARIAPGLAFGTLLALALPACAAVADAAARRALQRGQSDAVRGLIALGLPGHERWRRVGHAVVVAEMRRWFLLLQLLIASAVVVEAPFGATGLGRLTVEALRGGDTVLLAAAIVILGVTCVVVDAAGALVVAGRHARGQPRDT